MAKPCAREDPKCTQRSDLKAHGSGAEGNPLADAMEADAPARKKGSLARRLARCLIPRAGGRGSSGQKAAGPKAAAGQRHAASAAVDGRAQAAAWPSTPSTARAQEGTPADSAAADARPPADIPAAAVADARSAADDTGSACARSGLRELASREANPIITAAEEGDSCPSSPSGGAAAARPPRDLRLPRRSRALMTNGSVAALLSGAEATQWPPNSAPPLPQELLAEVSGEAEGVPEADASELLPPLPPPGAGGTPCAALPPSAREAAPQPPQPPQPRERPVPRSYRRSPAGAARGSLRDSCGDSKLASPSRPLTGMTGTTTGDDSLMNSSFSSTRQSFKSASWRDEWTPGSTQRLQRPGPSPGGPSRLPPIRSGKAPPPPAPPRLPPVDPGPLSRLPPMPPPPIPGREPEPPCVQPENDQWLSEAAMAAVPPALGSSWPRRALAAGGPAALAAEDAGGTPPGSQVLDEAGIKKAKFSELALAFISMEEFA